ncbi:MAG: hypothetical protein DMG84_23710 [Acidobacteria bacterium]|nr:MAG: hypothetical protein DMG84_23710 [Acidobacteriota bacterium]
MVKKLLVLLFASLLAFTLSVFAQDAPKETKAQEKAEEKAEKKAAKPARWDGIVTRVNKDKSTLNVRKVGSSQERTVEYDSSTKWVSQEHGKKKVNDIDADQVKDGDRVITTGTWDKNGVLHATLISKRLTPL